MTLTKRQRKALENQVDALFAKVNNGVQFNIMDLSKVLNETIDLHLTGVDLESALKTVSTKYRIN